MTTSQELSTTQKALNSPRKVAQTNLQSTPVFKASRDPYAVHSPTEPRKRTKTKSTVVDVVELTDEIQLPIGQADR